LLRVAHNLAWGEIPEEDQADVTGYAQLLRDHKCKIVGDMVSRLQDNAWWEGLQLPNRLVLAVQDAVTLASRAAAPEAIPLFH
jgi:hypothetical protein